MDFHKHENSIKISKEIRSKKNRESINYFEKVGEKMIKDFNIYNKEPYSFRRKDNSTTIKTSKSEINLETSKKNTRTTNKGYNYNIIRLFIFHIITIVFIFYVYYII